MDVQRDETLATAFHGDVLAMTWAMNIGATPSLNLERVIYLFLFFKKRHLTHTGFSNSYSICIHPYPGVRIRTTVEQRNGPRKNHEDCPFSFTFNLLRARQTSPVNHQEPHRRPRHVHVSMPLFLSGKRGGLPSWDFRVVYEWLRRWRAPQTQVGGAAKTLFIQKKFSRLE